MMLKLRAADLTLLVSSKPPFRDVNEVGDYFPLLIRLEKPPRTAILARNEFPNVSFASKLAPMSGLPTFAD